MDSAAFDALLTGPLSTRATWQRAHRCPCVDAGGSASAACPVCGGQGLYWDAPSLEFRCGVVGLSGKALERLQQRYGPGMVGDSTLSIPSTAPWYALAGPGDRFLLLDALDVREWTLAPGVPVKLPPGATMLSAHTLNAGVDAVVTTTLPTPDAQGRIQVSKSTTVRLRAPRLLELVADIGQVRSWQPGLPKKYLAKVVDVSVRW